MNDRKRDTSPHALDDETLDQASGGISLITPAVQSAQQPMTRSATPQLDPARIKLGDGSV